MNNVVKGFALAVCAVASLAGCADTSTGSGSGENAPRLPAAASNDDGAPAAAKQQTNKRGFIVKQLGEQACFGGASKNCEGGVSFAIDKVEVDPPCTEFGSHPDNGHTLILHFRIATGDDANVVDQISGVINPFSFVEIGKDGVTRDTSFGMCADPSTNQLPDTYGPNQQYQGVMDLEVPEASGTIALQLTAAEEDGQRGWEWAYPA
ncbi:hypothetical protein [Actinophytocola algeriensis]|uniref:Uncharacterized protein n=1 Tax=Actinophytocola algeriensis TaxID=1768010 RepID=A0A7W7Q374_9PSEU|nr:hypothetical protein [Actinophytocola algeriensis]MBB4905869.1 hypothetical protein [Actinophytocola algeriensis]MBE1472446.1 hypothetical protein [Actinophytocola algeriensis]